MILYKVDESGYGKRLPGAEFELHSNTGQYLKTYTTDDKGSITIKMPTDEELEKGAYPFEYNVVYYLVETKAPEGYLLPNPAPKYFFYFSKAGDGYTPLDSDQIPEGAVDLSVNGSVIYCENEKATTSITVDKKWLGKTDITGSKTGSVTFDLYQIANTTPPSESGGGTGGGNDGNVTVTIKIGEYGPGGEVLNAEYTCKSGSTVEFDIVSWGTPNLKFGSDFWNDKIPSIAPVSEVGKDPTTFHYQFEVTQSTLVQGLTSGNASQTINVSITEPSDPEPDPSPETPEDDLVGTYTIGPNTQYQGWTCTIDDLLKQETINGLTYYYTYYIVEQNGTRYDVSYENNDTQNGIVSGTITVTNTESDNPGYELPATGGTGTAPLYTMGAALSVSAGLLLVHKKKRRKEGRPSS